MMALRFSRRLGAGLAVLSLASAFVGCNDVGDNTGQNNGGGDDAGGADVTLPGEGGAGDTGASPEAASSDTGSGADSAQGPDGGTEEASAVDAADATVPEAAAPEAAVPEAAVPEAAAPEAAAPEATAPEAAAPEAAAPETGVPDASTDGSADAATDSSAHADSGPDASPDASHDAASDGSPGPLVPCTTAGQTGCVKCEGAGGVCTPTEALLLQKDIAHGKATTPGAAPVDPGDGTVCYSCAANAFCLDMASQSGFECHDLAGNFTNGAGASVSQSSACLATLACITSATGQQCALGANGVSDCYCGSGGGAATACKSSTAQNGPCLAQELAGFAYTPGSTAATTILGEYTSPTQPSGLANTLAQCAADNGCTACLQ